MIPGTPLLRQVPDWQTALGQAITDPAELLEVLGLGPEWLPAARDAARAFPLRVPRGFVARMRRSDPADPLLRQVLPLAEECQAVEGYGADPVGDLAAHKAPGVLHKYQGRVLLTATGACAIHCRYCFRRHFPYAEANASAEHWRAALDYVTLHPDVREVILSGGDPLTLSDRRLAEFVRTIEDIPHVERLRLHTRLPVVLPERVTPELCAWLSGTRLMTVVVIHANHAQELDAATRAACARLADSGATLLNQSVLLRGVNDSVTSLAQLSEALFAAGVLPYYLHQLDRVQGAAHFEVSDATARTLLAGLNACLPGYLVPRLVREVAGASGKTLLLS
ncbi:MAG TPA: EF-P beta-lysylation protein EpmB [Acidiferrobacterales bacterium]|nr:EF-P beta-lysylation protein EpmB [Acidiferrobacterales bacterium]